MSPPRHPIMLVLAVRLTVGSLGDRKAGLVAQFGPNLSHIFGRVVATRGLARVAPVFTGALGGVGGFARPRWLARDLDEPQRER